MIVRRLRRKFRDARPRPQRPASPGQDVFDWAPWTEIVLGPPRQRPDAWLPPLAAEPPQTGQEAAS
jgi:hypothetical protein